MSKDAAITVRVPAPLRKRLEARAKRERRSLSAQVVVDLERLLAEEATVSGPVESALGRFEGAKVPSEEDFVQVRQMLWGKLGRRG